jgi:hypothetical protein
VRKAKAASPVRWTLAAQPQPVSAQDHRQAVAFAEGDVVEGAAEGAGVGEIRGRVRDAGIIHDPGLAGHDGGPGADGKITAAVRAVVHRDQSAGGLVGRLDDVQRSAGAAGEQLVGDRCDRCAGGEIPGAGGQVRQDRRTAGERAEEHGDAAAGLRGDQHVAIQQQVHHRLTGGGEDGAVAEVGIEPVDVRPDRDEHAAIRGDDRLCPARRQGNRGLPRLAGHIEALDPAVEEEIGGLLMLHRLHPRGLRPAGAGSTNEGGEENRKDPGKKAAHGFRDDQETGAERSRNIS